MPSDLQNFCNLANLTPVFPEDSRGSAHPMLGCLTMHASLVDLTSANQFVFGKQLDSTMRGAGWTLVDKTGSTGDILWVIGIPPDQHSIRDPTSGLTIYPNAGPLFLYFWTADNAGNGIRSYNSEVDAPVDPAPFWGFGGVVWVPMGLTPEETTINLAAAMFGQARFPGDGLGSTHFQVIFPVGDSFGVLANERTFSSNGFFAISGNSETASKTWESQILQDTKIRLRFGVVNNNFAINHDVQVLDHVSGRYRTIHSQQRIMAQQPDYQIYVDPYSFYMRSFAEASHGGDIFEPNGSYFVTMPNVSTAIPANLAIAPIPTVAVASLDQWDLTTFSGSWWYFGLSEFTGTSAAHSGWAFLNFRQGPISLLSNTHGDAPSPARFGMATDCSQAISSTTPYPVGTSSGHLSYLGQFWNCAMIQRDLGSVFNSYAPSYDPASPTDAPLPKHWVVLFRQNGGEEEYFFRGSATNVLIAPIDQDYFDRTYNHPVPGSLAVVSTGDLNTLANTGNPFTVTFLASGGTGPYVWSATGLVTGWLFDVSLDTTTSSISGNPDPTQIGSHPVVVQVQDSIGTIFVLRYNVVIGTASLVSVTTTALDNGQIHIPYVATLGVQGGSGNYGDWHLVSGSLPPGIVLDASSGTLSGTPTVAATTYNFSVVVGDLTTGQYSAPVALSFHIN